MEIAQGLQQLAGPSDDLGLGGKLLPSQELVQALSLDKVHDSIDDAVLLYEIVHLRNVGVA